MWPVVIDCPFPFYALVIVAFFESLRDLYRVAIHFMQNVFTIRPCRLYFLLVALSTETVKRLYEGRVLFHKEMF